MKSIDIQRVRLRCSVALDTRCYPKVTLTNVKATSLRLTAHGSRLTAMRTGSLTSGSRPLLGVAVLFVQVFCTPLEVFAETEDRPHPLEAAQAAIKAKNEDEALKILSAFVRSHPQDDRAIEASFLLGQVQTRQRQIDHAFRTFGTVINSARGTEWAAKALEETA